MQNNDPQPGEEIPDDVIPVGLHRLVVDREALRVSRQGIFLTLRCRRCGVGESGNYTTELMHEMTMEDALAAIERGFEDISCFSNE
jgi:hypothetical protein